MCAMRAAWARRRFERAFAGHMRAVERRRRSHGRRPSLLQDQLHMALRRAVEG